MVPKIPSYRITDVATAVDAGCEQRIVGIRPGEKIHEEMITESDSGNTVDLGKYYAILPVGGEYNLQSYCESMKATPVEAGFRYESGSNPDFLSVAQLQHLISSQVSNMANH
jgi:FlaA1/EpsC-like NDP-sugar epimerase